MSGLVPFAGFDFTKLDYADFAELITSTPGCTVHDLGVCSDGANNVYGLSIGDLTSKPTIYIDGSIHGGHEWRCGYWVRRFMEILANPTGHPQYGWIQQFLARFSVYAIPCANPYGYINTEYLNANGVNLNRNFDAYWAAYQTTTPGDAKYKGTAPFSEPESAMVRDVVNSIKPIVFVNCHTWGGYNGSSFEIEKSAHKYGKIIERVSSTTARFSGKASSHMYYPYQEPRSAEWAAQQTSKNGTKTIAIAFEPGSLETEYDQALIGLNALYLMCAMSSKWFQDRVLN